MSNCNYYDLEINRTDSKTITPRCYEVNYLKASNKIKINIDKDENKSKNIYKGEGLCGRWCYENEKYMLFFQVNVGTNNKDYEKAKVNDKSLREKLPLMLNAIVKAEEKFLKENKDLLEAEIFIKFNCLCDDFYKVESFGKLKDYINIKKSEDNKLKEEEETNNKFRNANNKNDINKNLILNLINPYIETHLSSMYGKDARFLIKGIELLGIEELEVITGDHKEHEVVVSVIILNINKPEEVILSVIVKPNGVAIKKIA